ncbi:MAG: NifB/NifX family molybdenum-iron cluster-binding protein [Candidatus Delongbacteria bacterium]|jgi:predicted Fe-Mo cluster-binding NifX family protein|nr:NifB/NifX family molybdenum-iron cluster-binding protein [Candidatus Delongbacteria bacterium]
MKIAFTAKGKGWDAEIDPRFGRTEFIFIYNEETGEIENIDNSGVSEHAHGAGPMTAQIITEKNVNILITGNGPGGNAERVISAAGIKTIAGAGGMTVKQAYDAYKNNKLN